MSAALFPIKRGATLSRSAIASYRRGISRLLSHPPAAAAAAAASTSPSGAFLYSNRWGLVPHISQFVEPNRKRAFKVDTPGMVRRMESQEVPSKHTEVITELLNDSATLSFVSKGKMQKSEMARPANLLELQAQLRRSQSEMIRSANLCELQAQLWSSQDHLLSTVRRGHEKLLRDIKKMHDESRSEIRDALQEMCGELRVQLEEIKYNYLKCFIGTLVWVYTVGLAVIHIQM